MRRPVLLLPVAAAGCAMPPPRAPAPPVAAAAPTVVVPPTARDWRDEPLTPGAWRYAVDPAGRPTAGYGPAGGPVLLLRCRPARGAAPAGIALVRPAPAGTTLTVRTSFGERGIAGPIPPGAEAALDLPAGDPFWDRLAFSRGRFAVLGAGAPTLYLPAWGEPARVIEECRRPTPPLAPAPVPLPAPPAAPTSPPSST